MPEPPRQGRGGVEVGDCVEVMAAMPEHCVDAIVCDPPYGLGFMGKEWDKIGDTGRGARARTERVAEVTPVGEGHSTSAGPYLASGVDSLRSAGAPFQRWCEAWATEALRVLKPGGHLLAFGGTRTYHRLACAIEDAGFEVRDSLVWLYGSGFPKSLDVAKSIDKAAGAEREVVELNPSNRLGAVGKAPGGTGTMGGGVYTKRVETAPAPDAEYWQGWGTALKPAHEPIVLARKPLVGTVAGNVLAHGTGALNVDGCRIDFRGDADERESKDKNRHADFGSGARENRVYGADERARAENGNYDAPGRWPANVLLDPEAAAMLDEQSGELATHGDRRPGEARGDERAWRFRGGTQSADSGGASRFFYCAKADSTERNAGLGDRTDLFSPTDAPGRNDHPTVKPIALMRWLVRLVTPPGGTVLDPFTGSGTTGCAAALEGFGFIGIEREAAYAEIARARLAHWSLGAAA